MVFGPSVGGRGRFGLEGGNEGGNISFSQPPLAAKIFEILMKKQQILSIFSFLAIFLVEGEHFFGRPGSGVFPPVPPLPTYEGCAH